MAAQPFIFADRDGTLIEDPGFVHQIENFVPISGTVEGLRALQDAGFGLVIVTNQSGIGREIFSAADYHSFQHHLETEFAKAGVNIARSYHCPHTPEDGCLCRKPEAALIERACEDFDIDLAASWVIGDRPADMQLASHIGCSAVYVLTGQGAKRRAELPSGIPIAENLREASALILADRARNNS